MAFALINTGLGVCSGITDTLSVTQAAFGKDPAAEAAAHKRLISKV